MRRRGYVLGVKPKPLVRTRHGHKMAFRQYSGVLKPKHRRY